MVNTSTELTELIHDVINQHPGAQVPELAQHVAKLTSSRQLRDFYEEALRPFVADVMRRGCNTSINQVFRDSPSAPSRKPGQPISFKVKSISAWAQMMRESVVVGADTRKSLGQCTVDDLDYVIAMRDRQIVQLHTKREQFLKLRNHLAASGFKTLGETPEIVL